ncbi:hypothetical protein ACI3PI_07910 [Lactobacillus helveticus]|uniref:hypothetical protein n=1 Tax=Lactobacillus helveticus TaxID=1587 RepID=UPI0006ED45E4|nr:hypothetical protein [Lactobacillus helveticus]ALJ23363.1 hypothetical protein AO203_05495 [Lactobacillus gallinarum]ANZ56593.1 hypothetical protein BCM45_09560 [Lactobacillus helveticus]AQY53043.1 hypothetical protein BCM44_02395 [Lactobacillus helveticus]RHX82661.1 hypothetical protein DSY27_01820 [Lactobacillus helveticus]
MENIEPMDILREPTPEEETLATILRWVKDSHDNKENKTTTIVFKKNTPQKILKSFQRNTDLFVAITDYTINKQYEIEN